MSRQDFDSNLILVKDIMTKAIISVTNETTVFQVAKMMEQGGIGAVLVKKNGHLSGCSLYTSDAAEDSYRAHPGGRRSNEKINKT